MSKAGRKAQRLRARFLQAERRRIERQDGLAVLEEMRERRLRLQSWLRTKAALRARVSGP